MNLKQPFIPGQFAWNSGAVAVTQAISGHTASSLTGSVDHSMISSPENVYSSPYIYSYIYSDFSASASASASSSLSGLYSAPVYTTLPDVEPETDLTAALMLNRLLDHAASLLGLTPIELKQYLQDGDHMVHIVEHQGIAAEQFRELLCHNISLTLKEEYSSGKITQWQYDQYMDMLDEQLGIIISL